MESGSDTKIINNLARRFLKQTIAKAVSQGKIDLHNKDKAWEWILSQIQIIGKIDTPTCYEEDILKQANYFFENGKNEFALMFYATFIEHSLNWMLVCIMAKKGMNESQRTEIIRSANIQTKYGWLWELFELPQINNRIKENIKKISEQRNTFIHYKWKESNINLQDTTNLAKKAKSTCRYLLCLENRIEYNKQENDIDVFLAHPNQS